MLSSQVINLDPIIKKGNKPADLGTGFGFGNPVNKDLVCVKDVGGLGLLKGANSSESCSLPSNCVVRERLVYADDEWRVETFLDQEVKYGEYWSSSSSVSCLVQRFLSLRLNDPSRRNMLIWEESGGLCEEPYSLDRRITTHVKLTNLAVNQNAGIVLNYREALPPTYWVAQINRISNRVELLRFNGTILILENFVTPPIPFSLNDWYEIQTETQQVGADVNIQVRVRDVSDPSWPAVSFNFLTDDWGTPDGYFGIHTNRSRADFSFWELNDA
jgi:hypothetical protein